MTSMFPKNISGIVAMLMFSMGAMTGGISFAGAQEVFPLRAVQADAPPRNGLPAASTLERYAGTIEIYPKIAAGGRLSATQGNAVALAEAIPARFTVIAPVFVGENRNFSYIRFPNGGAGAATFNVTVIGSPTAHNYGTVTISVAQFASPQYSIMDFFKVLGITSVGPGDSAVSLYIQSPQGGNYIGFQHAVWNSSTGFFENASVCTFKPSIDYSGLNQAMFNVHTSTIRGYPGTIFLHNYADTEVAFRGNVFDAANGGFLGAFTISIPANVTAPMDISSIEAAIAFTPGPAQYHVNIQFQTLTGTAWNALASVAINGQQIQAYTNMSLVCSVNP